MQPLESARFSWRSQKGGDLSADLQEAARSATGNSSESESGESEEEDGPLPAVMPPSEAPSVMSTPELNGYQPQALVNQMPAMLWAIDSDLRFTSCRGGALTDLGIGPDQLVGMTLFDFFQTEDTNFPPIAASVRALRGEIVNYELDWGSRIFRVRVGPERNDAGQIVGTIAVVFDISEVRHEDEHLHQEDHFLRRVAENMPDAVVVVDGEGRFVYASPSCETVLGYALDQLDGVNFLTLIEPDDLAIAQDAIVDVYRGDSYSFAVRMKRRDGSVAVMETVGAAVTTGDDVRLLLVSMRDISDEKRSEEYVHHNQRMADLRNMAQETAETLRQLLIAIDRGETPTPDATIRAQVLSSAEGSQLLPDSP